MLSYTITPAFKQQECVEYERGMGEAQKAGRIRELFGYNLYVADRPADCRVVNQVLYGRHEIWNGGDPVAAIWVPTVRLKRPGSGTYNRTVNHRDAKFIERCRTELDRVLKRYEQGDEAAGDLLFRPRSYRKLKRVADVPYWLRYDEKKSSWRIDASIRIAGGRYYLDSGGGTTAQYDPRAPKAVKRQLVRYMAGHCDVLCRRRLMMLDSVLYCRFMLRDAQGEDAVSIWFPAANYNWRHGDENGHPYYHRFTVSRGFDDAAVKWLDQAIAKTRKGRERKTELILNLEDMFDFDIDYTHPRRMPDFVTKEAGGNRHFIHRAKRRPMRWSVNGRRRTIFEATTDAELISDRIMAMAKLHEPETFFPG